MDCFIALPKQILLLVQNVRKGSKFGCDFATITYLCRLPSSSLPFNIDRMISMSYLVSLKIIFGSKDSCHLGMKEV